jgi:two-component system alkaline phosphatase synthesis response regulator PhoP
MIKKFYTTFEIAEICSVYPTTVINWINQKKIKAHSTPGGHHRVSYEDLISFLKEYNMPIQKELLSEKKKVYIIDDDKIFSAMVSRIFSRNKDLFDIKIFSDGYDALINIGSDIPDLIVVDVIMPIMDGYTFCKKIRDMKNFKNVKIISVSGANLDKDLEEKISKITDGIFKKPIDVDKFKNFCFKLLNIKS